MTIKGIRDLALWKLRLLKDIKYSQDIYDNGVLDGQRAAFQEIIHATKIKAPAIIVPIKKQEDS